jgi:hypothetical protein
MKYVAVSNEGKFVTITIESIASGVPSGPAELHPIPVKTSLHKLKVTGGPDPSKTLISCSCGAEGYVCTKCLKVYCDYNDGKAVSGLCPTCVAQAGSKDGNAKG